LTPVHRLLLDEIAQTGPVPVSRFMERALGHPEHGYYRKKAPLGLAGDFTTAPEISQMFGELIGLWCAVVWQSMGSPAEIALAELGPGRGTLMADLLRAAALVPGFRAAIRLHLVETSRVLRTRQAASLAEAAPTWHDDLTTLPDQMPLLVVANEFLDALPIRQYVRRGATWHERLIGAEGETLAFVDGPPAIIDAPQAEDGAIFEINEPARTVAAALGQRLAAQGGAGLLIDYGHGASACGDTLQAVRRHAYAPLLDDPGEADLTAHVDFQAIARAASPAAAFGPVGQGAFLRALGIELRAEKLMRAAPAKANDIATACRRLIDGAEMGNLFKVLSLAHPALPVPPGFPL